jgi:hypothetical protein
MRKTKSLKLLCFFKTTSIYRFTELLRRKKEWTFFFGEAKHWLFERKETHIWNSLNILDLKKLFLWLDRIPINKLLN